MSVAAPVNVISYHNTIKIHTSYTMLNCKPVSQNVNTGYYASSKCSSKSLSLVNASSTQGIKQ